MTFNDFRVTYDLDSDAIRLNGFVIQFSALWEQMRKIQLKRLQAQVPSIPEQIQTIQEIGPIQFASDCGPGHSIS